MAAAPSDAGENGSLASALKPMSPAPPSGRKGPRAGGFRESEETTPGRALQALGLLEDMDVTSIGFTPRITRAADSAALQNAMSGEVPSEVIAQIKGNEVDTLCLQCKELLRSLSFLRWNIFCRS